MFCPKCGNEIIGEYSTCPYCGASLKENTSVNPVETKFVTGTTSSSKVLTWAIVAAACAGTGILGIIFSIIARKNVKRYLVENGSFDGKAKAGSIVSKIALICSIIATVVIAIYIIVLIIAIGAGAFDYYYYY